MIYDIILCVHPKDADIAVKAIRALHHFLKSRKIFVIAKTETFQKINKRVQPDILLDFLDEEKMREGLSREKVSDILAQKMGYRIDPGWYYQQFLKMAVAQFPEVADHYLIWDSDTILLSPITFFDDEGAILFNPQAENHRPYFEWIENVLGIQKQVEFSFIDQHMMINKLYMNELIRILQDKAPSGKRWYWQILNSINNKHLEGAGFSEFETYGNFVMWRYPGSYKSRRLKTTRGGTNRFGPFPSKHDFFKLMTKELDICTFENYHPWSFTNVLLHKISSRKHYWECKIRGVKKHRLRDAHLIVNKG